MTDNPHKQRYVSDLFITATPTNSGKADIDTIRKIDQLPYLLQKGFCPVTSMKKGLSRGRTEVLKVLKGHLEANNIKHDGFARILWLDDDCIIDYGFDIKLLAGWIRHADENGWDLIANYKEPVQGQETNCLFHKAGKDERGSNLYRMYTDQEIAGLTELQELPETVGGMGFMYVTTPLDYEFHDEGSGNGEDLNFIEDTNARFRFMPVRIFHEKRIWI